MWVENGENNTNNSSLCKICAQNGFPNVRIYWKRFEREDGSTGWVPCENEECTIRHTHRHLYAKPLAEEKLPVEDEPQEVSAREHQEPLSETEIMQILLEVHELSQKQNSLLKGLLDNLGHLR